MTFLHDMLKLTVNISYIMSLTLKEQIRDQINKSNNILICVGKNSDGDNIGSALAVYTFLQKIQKRVDITSPNMILEKYAFLPYINTITHDIQGARDYVFSLDVNKQNLHQLKYEVEENKLKIYITTKNKEIQENQILLESSKFVYDLIITLGVSDLDYLGNIYDENSELFYETPIINIDHRPSNEHYGKMNLIDVSASSTAEIIFNILREIDDNLIDEAIATNLLTGIITATESFQNKNTTPKIFLTAAALISKGANKQEIVRYLYKTRTVSMLKLMGKVMTNLKYNKQHKLAWSVITESEFRKEAINDEDINTIIKELIGSTPEFDTLFILYPKNDYIKCAMSFPDKYPSTQLEQLFNGYITDNQITFHTQATNLEQAEQEVLQKIQKLTQSKTSTE